MALSSVGDRTQIKTSISIRDNVTVKKNNAVAAGETIPDRATVR